MNLICISYSQNFVIAMNDVCNVECVDIEKLKVR